MKHKNEKRTIAYMLCISILLLTLGLYTAFASVSLANPANSAITYDVYFSSVGTNNKTKSNVIVTNNRIDIDVSFKEYGEEFVAATSLNNDGNVNLKIDKLIKTDLEDIEVGKSIKTDKVYTLADYLAYRVYYTYDNEENNINAINNVVENDLLKSKTANNITIKVALKNEEQLTQDQKDLFEDLGGINASLFLEALCLEV